MERVRKCDIKERERPIRGKKEKRDVERGRERERKR